MQQLPQSYRRKLARSFAVTVSKLSIVFFFGAEIFELLMPGRIRNSFAPSIFIYPLALSLLILSLRPMAGDYSELGSWANRSRTWVACLVAAILSATSYKFMILATVNVPFASTLLSILTASVVLFVSLLIWLSSGNSPES